VASKCGLRFSSWVAFSSLHVQRSALCHLSLSLGLSSSYPPLLPPIVLGAVGEQRINQHQLEGEGGGGVCHNSECCVLSRKRDMTPSWQSHSNHVIFVSYAEYKEDEGERAK
jgi:hypothetical protein